MRQFGPLAGGMVGRSAFARASPSLKRDLSTSVANSGNRAFNFSAGPACLPTPVMEEAQKQFTDHNGSGMGIMEMSHRDAGGPVQSYVTRATDALKELLDVPDTHQVLFAQGGAHGQFSAIPLNFLGNKQRADFIKTGWWSQRAIEEASLFVPNVHVAATSEPDNFLKLPLDTAKWDIGSAEESAFVHFCGNETIHGVEYLKDPVLPAGAPPLIADMTSTLLSRRVDVSKYGMLYCSGGKNLGPAGVCAIIIREDLLERSMNATGVPSVLNYHKLASSQPIPSIYNTPPTFLVYMTALTLENQIKQGGLEATEKRVKSHADLVYGLIDGSDGFYSQGVDPECRSVMSIPFRIGRPADPELETKFTQESEAQGLLQLFGHPLFGGMRVTCYNGIPDEAYERLEKFMIDFQKKYDN